MIRPAVGQQNVCGDYHFVANLIERQLGQLIMMDSVGADSAERLAGKVAQFGPVYDQFSALLIKIIAISGGKFAHQDNAPIFRHLIHLPVQRIECRLLLTCCAGVDIVGLVAECQRDRVLAGDDVFK
ncbi:MAG: hypothetical protein MO846_10230 [Candidatus Devosia symbiotica]|nr:hypothetical protein [Candidatus Devosia symbiotica]